MRTRGKKLVVEVMDFRGDQWGWLVYDSHTGETYWQNLNGILATLTRIDPGADRFYYNLEFQLEICGVGLAWEE